MDILLSSGQICVKSFTYYQGGNELRVSGFRNRRDEIRDQKSGIRDQKPWDLIGISSFFFFFFLKDQAVPFLWDQGPEFVTLLESRIRNLSTKVGSAMKKYTSVVTSLTIFAYT